jgi:hypothetical protein
MHITTISKCGRNHKTFTVILLDVGLSTSKLNEQERFVIPAHFGNHTQSHDSCELLVRDAHMSGNASGQSDKPDNRPDNPENPDKQPDNPTAIQLYQIASVDRA